MDLKVQIKQEEDIFTVSPIGSINSESASYFESEINKVLSHLPKLLIFDMSRLHFITSMGIGVLIKAERFFSEKKGKLMLINLPPQIQKVIKIIKSLPNLKMFKDRQELDNYLLSMQESEINEDK